MAIRRCRYWVGRSPWVAHTVAGHGRSGWGRIVVVSVAMGGCTAMLFAIQSANYIWHNDFAALDELPIRRWTHPLEAPNDWEWNHHEWMGADFLSGARPAIHGSRVLDPADARVPTTRERRLADRAFEVCSIEYDDWLLTITWHGWPVRIFTRSWVIRLPDRHSYIGSDAALPIMQVRQSGSRIGTVWIPSSIDALAFAVAAAVHSLPYMVIGLATISLRSARRRRAGRCVACGYLLSSTAAGPSRCPECGELARDRTGTPTKSELSPSKRHVTSDGGGV